MSTEKKDYALMVAAYMITTVIIVFTLDDLSFKSFLIASVLVAFSAVLQWYFNKHLKNNTP